MRNKIVLTRTSCLVIENMRMAVEVLTGKQVRIEHFEFTSDGETIKIKGKVCLTSIKFYSQSQPILCEVVFTQYGKGSSIMNFENKQYAIFRDERGVIRVTDETPRADRKEKHIISRVGRSNHRRWTERW